MTINDLTIGELKKLASVFDARPAPHPFVGRYVLVRTYSAGVHAGELVSQDGDLVLLKNSRRLWSWEAKEGVALSGVAVSGIKAGKIDTIVTEIFLTGAIETICCSDAAKESISNA